MTEEQQGGTATGTEAIATVTQDASETVVAVADEPAETSQTIAEIEAARGRRREA